MSLLVLQKQRRSFSVLAQDVPTLPNSAEPVGRPLPLDEHACSVSLPTWCSVVGYEEGNTEVTSKMICGYPRFVYHPYVLQLMDHVVEHHGSADQDCLVLPTPEAAARCLVFLQQALYGTKGLVDNALVDTTVTTNSDDKIKIVSLANDTVHAVLFPAETLAGTEAKAYWQHTGEIVSSRRAEVALCALGVEVKHITPQLTASASTIVHHVATANCDSVFGKLQERIAKLTNVPPSHVHLVPSGMASIYMALRSSRRLKMEKKANGGKSIVFGFPYLDTLKQCSRKELCPGGVEFFGKGLQDDLTKLEVMLQQDKQDEYCALFTEVPSNPLLQTPDVNKLRELATDHNFALVVDDTIGNFSNINMLGEKGADAICSSLTKLFSGYGDVMAGSLVANPNTETGMRLQADLEQQKESCGLFSADGWAMYHNSEDFLERNAVINDTSERLSDWLKDHKDVGTVYYPKYNELYSQVETGRGYGGLLSILLEQHICQRTFYDALDISKGPSLGTNFTLMCPYTLLAHYHELDFAMACDVQPNLLRIAIGLEPFEVLQKRFEMAFEKSRLHPPLPKPIAQQQKRMYTTTTATTTTTTTTTTTRRLTRFGLDLSKRFVR
jgi:cystathionine gamma-synthase